MAVYVAKTCLCVVMYCNNLLIKTVVLHVLMSLSHLAVIDPGVVPEPALQREEDEAAERLGSPQACLLQESKEDETTGGPPGAWGAHPQWALLILWR